MANPYSIPREARATGILSGNGGASYGPFGFKIFDTADVEVITKPDGAEGFSAVAVTVAKVSSAALEHFTITFPAALPATTKFQVRGRRVHERSAGVTAGTKLSPDALERELSKQAATLEELRRDAPDIDPDIEDGQSIIRKGGRLVGGPEASVIEAIPGLAAQVAADRVQTGLDRAATAADRVQTGLDRKQTGLDRAAARASEQNAANIVIFAGSDDGYELPTPTPADGSLFRLIVPGAGMQGWKVEGGSWVLKGWIGRVAFTTRNELLSFTGVVGPSGTILLGGNGQYMVADGGATDHDHTGADGQKYYDLQKRTAVAAAHLAQSPDGTVGELGGLQYVVDSSATGAVSALNDKGVNGLRPFGETYAEHYGFAATATAVSNATALQSAIDNSSGGTVTVRTAATIEGDVYLRNDVVFDNYGYTLTINNGGFHVDGAENGGHVDYWEAKIDVARTGVPGPAINLVGDDTSGANKAAIRGRLFPIIRSSTGKGIRIANAYILDIFHPSIRNCVDEGWEFTYGPTGNVAVNAVSIFGGETQQCGRFMVSRGVSGINWYGHTPEGNRRKSIIDHATRGMRFIGGYCEKNAFDETGNNARDFVCEKVTQLIAFDAKTADFTVGQTLTAASGGSAVIEEVYTLSGSSGRLLVSGYSGTFANNAALTDGAGGAATANGSLYGSSPILISWDGVEFWEGTGGSEYPIRLVDGLQVSVRNCRAASTAWTGLIDYAPGAPGAVTGEHGNNYVSSPTIETNATANLHFAPYDSREKKLTGAFTWDIPSLAAGAIETTTTTVSGADIGDFVLIQRGSNNSTLLISAYVESANTIRVYASNQGSSTVDLGNATFRVIVTPKNYYF